MEFIITALSIALAVSMDSFAVSISCGLQKSMNIKRAIFLSLCFAFFQGLFPLLGILLGNVTKDFIGLISHWIAFGLLAVIGLKMFLEGRKYDVRAKVFDFTKLPILIMLAVATSIDAFILGIGFGLEYILREQIIILIGITVSTFIFSLIGAFMGMRAYFFKPKIALMFAGAILIGLGLKIIVAHLLS